MLVSDHVLSMGTIVPDKCFSMSSELMGPHAMRCHTTYMYHGVTLADMFVQLFKYELARELENGISTAESPGSNINLLAALVEQGQVSVSVCFMSHFSLVPHA